MSIKIITKYKELETLMEKLTIRNALLLGCMSMARTYRILNVISNEEGFEALKRFKATKDIILDAVLDDNKEKLEFIQSYICVCEQLVPLLEDYEQSNLSEDISHIMDCKYSLVEKWFYFLDINYINLDGISRVGLATFVIVGLEMVQQYLESKCWNIIKDAEIRQRVINKDILIKNEIERIDKDISFLNSSHSSNEIRQYINNYCQTDILKG